MCKDQHDKKISLKNCANMLKPTFTNQGICFAYNAKYLSKLYKNTTYLNFFQKHFAAKPGEKLRYVLSLYEIQVCLH